jgi:hypothetical protein
LFVQKTGIEGVLDGAFFPRLQFSGYSMAQATRKSSNAQVSPSCLGLKISAYLYEESQYM